MMETFLIEFGFIHMVIIILLSYLLFYLIFLNRSISLRCKIDRHCVNGKNNRKCELPFKKYVFCIYKGMVRGLSLFLMKIPMMDKYIKEYKKYITSSNKSDIIPADFISNKILLSAIFLLIINIIGSIDGNLVIDAEVIVFTLLGYVIPDLYYDIKYNKK
jgi:hypothetical protein